MNLAKPAGSPGIRARFVFSCLVIALAIVGSFPLLQAHDIPGDTTVRAFIRPEGQKLRLLLRVPMASIHDINWPIRRTDGTLDVPQLDPALRDAVDIWILDSVSMHENGTRLPEPTVAAVRLSLDGDPFASYETALATVTGPRIPDDTRLLPTQGMLDMMLEYPIQSDRSRFSFDHHFDRFGLRVVMIMRYEPPTRAARAFEYTRGAPGLIHLDPTLWQVAMNFTSMGFRHIIDGPDHLIFLLVLVLPLRRFFPLVAVVTGFTIAHSITLIASAYGMAPGALWFPPLIDTLIAASIVYLAMENVVVSMPKRRWAVAFGFGLVHGFGLAIAFTPELQFAGSHFLASLLFFNFGLEAGQVAILIVMVMAIALLFRLVPERGGTIVLSAIAGHTAWHWTLERYSQWWRYRFEFPELDAAFLANAMRWLMVFVAIAFAYWILGVLRAKSENRG